MIKSLEEAAKGMDEAVENRLIGMMKENSPKLLSYFLTVATKTMLDVNAETFEMSQVSTHNNKRYKTSAIFTIKKLRQAKTALSNHKK